MKTTTIIKTVLALLSMMEVEPLLALDTSPRVEVRICKKSWTKMAAEHTQALVKAPTGLCRICTGDNQTQPNKYPQTPVQTL